MFAIGNEELKEAPLIGETILCHKCGKNHKVRYGKKILPDGTEIESKLLAYYKCNDQSFLAGIEGRDIRGLR